MQDATNKDLQLFFFPFTSDPKPLAQKKAIILDIEYVIEGRIWHTPPLLNTERVTS